MKKLLALTLMMMGLTAQAATSGSLVLEGVVSENLEIAVNAETVAANLDLETTQTDLLVATVDENSNSNTGYNITVSSANNGTLKRNSGTETIAYTLKYDGALLNLTSSASTPVEAKDVSTAGVYADTSNVQISYVGAADSTRVAGTYSDTVTFEIAAN